MKNTRSLTSDRLFDEFCRANWMNSSSGKEIWNEFLDLEDKSIFFDDAICFIEEQKQEDEVRRWGVTVLKHTGKTEALEFLIDLLRNEDTDELKMKFRLTRCLALAAIDSLASPDSKLDDLMELCRKMSKDGDEDYHAQAMGAIILVRHLHEEYKKQVKEMLTAHERDDYWRTWSALRALLECPLPEFKHDITQIAEGSQYKELRIRAIHTLGSYTNDLDVINILGNFITSSPKEYFRLAAVQSLDRIQNPASKSYLIQALHDKYAEVRKQALDALLKILTKEEAISAILQYALREEVEKKHEAYLIEALRRIDRDLSTKIISEKLSSQDRKQIQTVERMLIDLGGSRAVQILNQRRMTLESLDRLLAKSEEAVKNSFKGIIYQAQRNFYFAMAVNALIVLVGLILIALAVLQLVRDPTKLEAWIIPGGAGVVGIVVNLFFNDPRQNARKDLVALANMNVIFLGFLRQLYEIDATFKQAYIEGHEFGKKQAQDTVEQLATAMEKALKMTDTYICTFRKDKRKKA